MSNKLFVGNLSYNVTENDIQDLFRANLLPTAAALSVTLMVAIIAMVLVYVRKAGTEELL